MSTFSFVHLSDAHFTSYLNPSLDQFRRIRQECVKDIQRLVTAEPIHAVAFTGDIARKGSEDEYTLAADWLAHLTSQCGIDPFNVLTVPGNHDVMRSRIDEASRVVHESIRAEQDPEKRQARLSRLLNDPDVVGQFYDPLYNYNDRLASRFDCDITPDHHYWERCFTLANGYRIAFVGLNSTLLSDASDDDARNRLMLGNHQTIGERQRGCLQVSLCHHPTDWLLDRDNARRLLRSRFEIQLYGHKHEYDSEFSTETAVIQAGALQPEPGDGTSPRYSVIRVTVENESAKISVYDREFRQDQQCFVGIPYRQADYREETLVLHEDVRIVTEPTIQAELIVPQEAATAAVVANAKDEAKRALIYSFNTLSALERSNVAKALGLAQPDDPQMLDIRLPRTYLKRAEQAGKLGELWDVLAAYQPFTQSANPFVEEP